MRIVGSGRASWSGCRSTREMALSRGRCALERWRPGARLFLDEQPFKKLDVPREVPGAQVLLAAAAVRGAGEPLPQRGIAEQRHHGARVGPEIGGLDQ